jgi:ParB-like chromosome segregation protein Spo0J
MGSKNIPGTVRWDARAAETPEIIKILSGFNARTDLGDLASLKQSIQQTGVKDALWVRPDYADQEKPFILIDGERRLTVLTELYHEYQEAEKPWDIKIPLQIFYVDAEEAEELMALALLERKEPSFCDEAGLVSRWLGRNFSVQEISTKLNRSTAWVEQRRCFSLLAPQVKQAVRDGKISVQAALDVARKVPQSKQAAILSTVLKKSESKKQTRKIVAGCTGTVVRPGKRELVKVLARVDELQVNGALLSVKEAKRLVLAALRYCCGEIAPDQFLNQYGTAMRDGPPRHVVNHLEL